MNAQAMLIEEPETAPKKRTRSVQKAELPAPSGVDGILYLATRPDLDVEKVEKLIALYNAERARLAKEEFDRHFAIVQRGVEAVPRNGEARDEHGKLLYRYVKLGDLVGAYKNPLNDEKLSYRWSHELIDEKHLKVVCYIEGYGHTQTADFIVPIQDPTRFANSIQQQGSSLSYGKRYSFASNVGALIDDDDDGKGSFEEGVKYGNQVTLLRESETSQDLAANWKTILAGLGNDQEGKKFLYGIYEARKKELLK